MPKTLPKFLLRLLIFTVILFAVHNYLIFQFFAGNLYFPLWMVYLFNAALVLIVYSTLSHKVDTGSTKIVYLFFALTIGKMILAIVFLSPLFFKETDNLQLEIFNFFIPYFLFLAFEIFSISKFLQKL